MSEDAGDSRFLLFCKDDPTRPTEYRWCGVVVEQDGEVLDAILQPTEEALLLWFDGWQSGRKSAGFDNARKDERPMTVDEIIRLRSEAINADLLAALKAARRIIIAAVTLGADLPGFDPAQHSVVVKMDATIARVEPPGTDRGKDAP